MRNNKGQFIKGNKPTNGFKKGHKPVAGFNVGRIPWNKGKIGAQKMSTETRKKMSISAKNSKNLGRFKPGFIPWIKGRVGVFKHTKEWKEEARKRMWRGGLSFEPYSTDWTRTLKKSIRERDHYICNICLSDGCFVHHIDYNKKNCSPDNLITLCHNCHSKTNHNREYWIKYFNK